MSNQEQEQIKKLKDQLQTFQNNLHASKNKNNELIKELEEFKKKNPTNPSPPIIPS